MFLNKKCTGDGTSSDDLYQRVREVKKRGEFPPDKLHFMEYVHAVYNNYKNPNPPRQDRSIKAVKADSLTVLLMCVNSMSHQFLSKSLES